MTGILRPGTIFAEYRIERVLGAGGMGTVYLARHPRLPRSDALKVLPEILSAEAEFRARFLREADIAARLDHPNIVTVHDRGIDRGCLWLSMQFIEGFDAADLIRRHPHGLAPDTAAHITAEAARGLDEAHQAGMLHRDVKPANILLQPRPDRPDRVFVTDFGIAKAAGESTMLTRTGTVLATLAYAAPEQITAGTVDHRVDVYALGCTFFELLTGRKPFPRDTTAAVMLAHVQEPPPRASEVRPELPPAIDTVIARAMAKNPADRYDSCGRFADAVAAGLRGTPDTTPGTVRPAPRTRTRRRAALAVAVAAVIGLAVVSTVVLNRNSARPTAAAPAPTTSSASTTPISTTGAGAATWGNYAFIIDALPQLLPATPVTSGYQALRCRAVDDDLNSVDVNAQPEKKVQLACDGNLKPLQYLHLVCRSDRVPSHFGIDTDHKTQVGDQQWQRASGHGRVVWGDLHSDNGENSGYLDLSFDDPARNFCLLYVDGAKDSTAADVYGWWRDGPL